MDIISDETVVGVIPEPSESRQSADITVPFTPSPESNENPTLPVGEIFYPDSFRRSADMSGFRAAKRGFVAYFFNPAQHWASPEFSAGHVMTGRRPTQQQGGMAPFASRANIPDTQASSYGQIVQQSTYDLGLDPNSGW